MKKLIAATVILASLALAQGLTCVIDYLPLIQTGQSRVVDGVLLHEYKCVRGHIYWVR